MKNDNGGQSIDVAVEKKTTLNWIWLLLQVALGQLPANEESERYAVVVMDDKGGTAERIPARSPGEAESMRNRVLNAAAAMGPSKAKEVTARQGWNHYARLGTHG